jgi:hypothetical protein
VPDLTLTDDELRDVCIALRSAAFRAMEVATSRHCSPHISETFAHDQRRFNELAEKLSALRACSVPDPPVEGAVRSLWRT